MSSDEKKYTEIELKQELMSRELNSMKSVYSDHMRDEQKQWSNQNSKLETLLDSVRSIPSTITECRHDLETEIRVEFMPRKEVNAMEKRLDRRIDDMTAVVGAKIDSLHTDMKAENAKLVNKATGIIVGFTGAIALVGLVLKLTGIV